MGAGLGLSLLGPPIHQRVDQWLHILLIDGFGLGVELEYCMWTILLWLKPFGLGLCILYETTLDWLAFALMSTLTKDEHQTPRGIGWPAWPRPTGLGFLPFWTNFVHVVPTFKYSQKLVELININQIWFVLALKS